MTPYQQGRFCAQCQKTVVDFTTMTDAQVLAHLQQTSGPGCGRFRSDQLNRVLAEPLNRRVSRWQWASLLLSGWLSSQTVQAQSGIEPNGSAVVHTDTSSANTAIEPAKQLSTITIKGQVVSATDYQPIKNVTVIVTQTNYNTSTDTTGAFQLTIPVLPTDSITQLSARLIGYTEKSILLSTITQPVRIELEEEIEVLEDAIAGGYVPQKPTLWQRIRYWFKR